VNAANGGSSGNNTNGGGASPRPSMMSVSADNVVQARPSVGHAPHVEPIEANKPPIRITSRIVFLKVGQVDTRNERYDAEAYIECFWEDDQIFKILSDPNMAKNSKRFFCYATFI
jgi:hypothetical protein